MAAMFASMCSSGMFSCKSFNYLIYLFDHKGPRPLICETIKIEIWQTIKQPNLQNLLVSFRVLIEKASLRLSPLLVTHLSLTNYDPIKGLIPKLPGQ